MEKRQWLRRIGLPERLDEKKMQQRVQSTMKLFQGYVNSIYPKMHHWWVGAL
jgi:hypothetical protein